MSRVVFEQTAFGIVEDEIFGIASPVLGKGFFSKVVSQTSFLKGIGTDVIDAFTAGS